MSHEVTHKFALRSVAKAPFEFLVWCLWHDFLAQRTEGPCSYLTARPSQEHFPFVLLDLLLGGVLAVLDAVAQAPHHGEINLLFADLVFDTVVNARVVIHFNHDRVTVDFFEVNAVEPITDKACNAERCFHNSVRHAFDREAIPLAASFVLVFAIPVVYLPVVLGHVVFAGVERLAVENADSPVEIRGRKFLRNQKVAVLEHRVENLFEFFLVVRLFDAHAKAGIWSLDDHGEAEFLRERVAVFAVGDNRLRCGNLADRHEFLQINFIGTTQDAVGIVDDGDAFALGAACKRIRVVVDVRRFANEDGVEFAYAVVVGLGDHLHAETRFLSGLDKELDGFLIARRLDFFGVREDAQVVNIFFGLGRHKAFFLEVFDGELIDHVLVRFGNFVNADRADGLDEPFLLEHELGAKQRGLEKAVKRLRKFQVLWAHVLPEVNRKYELRSGEFAEALLDEFVDIVADDFHDGRSLEVADILDVRDDLVTACFGKQAHVIALALVAVVLAQVKNADVFLSCKVGIG